MLHAIRSASEDSRVDTDTGDALGPIRTDWWKAGGDSAVSDQPTSAGRYRVLVTDAKSSTVLLLDRETFEPTTLTVDAKSEVPVETLDGLRAGYVIDTELVWDDGLARARRCSVVEWTLFAFRDGVSNLFEVALDTWQEAQRDSLGVNSSVTFSNDGAPNGALYTFAEQAGETDLFAEFMDGRRPLDPLLDQIDRDPPYEVFVLRPMTHSFVLVYVVFAKDSILADTVRDTYECPRPTEPLRE